MYLTNKIMNDSINKRIRIVRDSCFKRNIDFAAAMGKNPNVTTNWVREGYSVGSNVAVEISEKLNISLDWLLTGRGSMFAEDSVIQPEESNEQPDIEKELIQLRQEKQELLNTVMRLNERITCLNDTITRLNMQIHDMMFSGESSRHDAV